MNGSPILTHMPKVGKSLERRTARDLIADKLMVLVATNMLRPGDVLPGERELASVLHVSRETVRGQSRRWRRAVWSRCRKEAERASGMSI